MEGKLKFKQLWEKLTYSQSGHHMFDALLDHFIFWLDLGRNPNHLKNSDCTEKEKEVMWEMFKIYGEIADNGGEGNYDFWGDFYMENYSNKHRGQFFTPQPICDMCAKMIVTETDKHHTVADPCCGSSRMLLAANKVNRNFTAYAADIDIRCVKMSIINLAINCIHSYVGWMDTLKMDVFAQWEIYICPITRLPAILELDKDLPIFGKAYKDMMPAQINQRKHQSGSQLLFDFMEDVQTSK